LAAKIADPALDMRHPARVPGNPHHGPHASYLNAAVIFTVLTGQAPLATGFDRIPADKYCPVEIALEPAEAHWFQALALRTVAGYAVGAGYRAPALPAELPDTAVPWNPQLSLEQRNAARIAVRWKIYEAMLAPRPKPGQGVITEYNRGVLDALIEDFPDTPDAAKAAQILKERGDDQGHDDSDRKR
jgi:hypothetical protein